MNKKALIVTHTGVSDEELIYSYYRLQEDGFGVDIMSDVVSGPQNPKPLKGVNGCSFRSDLSLNELSFKRFLNKHFFDHDLLILPGGVKGIEKLRQDQYVIDFIKYWNEKCKVIGAICHGSQLLIEADICKTRKISGYYSIKRDIENAGGIYVDEPAVVDVNIVTTAHYKDQGYWMKKLLEVYYEKNNKQ